MKDNNNQQLRIVFMGTPDFAVASLRSLVEQGYSVVGVVTQPDRPKGRKRMLTPPPVKEEAVRLGIPVYQPEKLREPGAIDPILAFKPDLIVTAAFGQILPKALLEAPVHRCINVHASLLPQYRGGAPIHYAVMNGEPTTGVTIMYMAEGLDTGDMISKVELPIEPDDNTGTMHDKLSIAGAQLLIDTIPELIAGKLEAIPQNHEEATYAPNIKREDERIDWSRSALQIHNQVRGLCPWPVAFTAWNGSNLKIWKTQLESPEGVRSKANVSAHVKPGTVVQMDAAGIEVMTGDGTIWLMEIQPSGKKAMPITEFSKGSAIPEGIVLGE